MKSGIILTALVFLSITAFSATHYVPDNYATIQGAIDASSNGDVVIVKPGTYVENIDFLGKAITVQSEKGAAVTIIDGNQANNVARFTNSEGRDSVLEGFTLTNGFATTDTNNQGGGIYLDSSSPSILRNIVFGNYAPNDGGGIYTKDVSSPAIVGNHVINNICDDRGGGIYISSYSTAEVVNNLIVSNLSNNEGGGVGFHESTPTLVNNTISHNIANLGGGLMAKGSSNPLVVNSIIWDNTAYIGYSEIYSWNGGIVTAKYSDIRGGCPGTGNIDADPLFTESANNDYHLTWNSPCRDKGDNSYVTESHDFEGDFRVALNTVDMGADEYYYHLYHVGDVIPGSPIDIKVVGYPSAPITLYLGSGIQDPPLSTQYGDLWLNWPPLWQGNIGKVQSNGVLVFSATVPTSWMSGSEQPLQALVGPMSGPWTRLANLEVLVVE